MALAKTVVGMLSIVALSACSSASVAPAQEASAGRGAYPPGHVHGLQVDPDSGSVLLATHEGLFDLTDPSNERIGPLIDLMGFTASGGTLYASGHPGPGVDLPAPLGLIRSTDQGKSWELLSRQGESDFHTLAAGQDGIVGYDGRIRTTPDGLSWQDGPADLAAHALAGSESSGVVLATTEKGLQRSTDGGASWAEVQGAPLLLLAALDGGTAAGVAPDGRIYTSDDAGASWMEQGSVQGTPAAIDVVAESAAAGASAGIWVATDSGVQVSDDGGTTFTPLR